MLVLVFQEDITNMIYHVPTIGGSAQQYTANHHDSKFLIALFYYFQDSNLLHVSTPYDKIKSGYMQSLKDITVGLFEFRLDILHLLGDQCILSGLSKVKKEMLKPLFIPLVWSVILTIFAVSKVSKSKPWAEQMKQRSLQAMMFSLLYLISEM